MSFQRFDEKSTQHVTPYGEPQVVVQTLNFNPLDDKQKFPHRNTFEPFLFRLVTLLFVALTYVAYCIVVATVPILIRAELNLAAAIGISVPVLACIAVVLYFAKPDYWIKVDRVSQELLITKTRSGGYCSSGPSHRVPLSQVRDIQLFNSGNCCGACLGRTFTIEAHMVDGSVLRLSPLCDLTQTRAFTEAGKLMNAIRLSRGEPMVINI